MQTRDFKLLVYESTTWFLIPLGYVFLPVVVAIFASPPLCWDALAYLILFMGAFVFMQLFDKDYNFGTIFLVITFLVLYFVYYPLTAWLLRKIF